MKDYFWYMLGGLVVGVGSELIIKNAVKAACQPMLVERNNNMHEVEKFGKENTATKG